LLAFHVCDWLRDTRDLLLDRGMMGDGVVDLAGMRGNVERAGYNGLIEVEIFSKENWWRRDPGEVLRICADRLQTVC
jgi:sugar phosphate isomerase/epimerase